MEIFELRKENREWWIIDSKVFKPCPSRTNAINRALAYYFLKHKGITHLRITLEEFEDEDTNT